MSPEQRGQGAPTPASERVLKPENIDSIHEVGGKSTIALVEKLDNFKKETKNALEQITGAKRLEFEKKIRELTKRASEIAKESLEFEGEDEKIAGVQEKIENLENEISDALEMLQVEINDWERTKDKNAAVEKAEYDKAIKGFEELSKSLDKKLGGKGVTPEVKYLITTFKTDLRVFSLAKENKTPGYDFAGAISNLVDKAKEIDNKITELKANDKKLKIDVDVESSLKEKLKNMAAVEQKSTSGDFEVTPAINDLLKRVQAFRKKVKGIKTTAAVGFVARAESLANEVTVIVKEVDSDKQLETILESEEKLAELEAELESENFYKTSVENKTKARTSKEERETKAEEERLAEEKRKKEEANFLKQQKAVERKRKKEAKNDENYETAKNRSREIPVSLMAEFVESARAGSAKAVSETVNFILSNELKDIINGEMDKDAHIEAIKNMFDNSNPDPALLDKLKKYGIEDWNLFIKVWKNSLAKEKVAPAMEVWLRGEMIRKAATTSEKGSGAEKFFAILNNMGIVSPVAQKIVFSVALVGGGTMAGGLLLSGVGVAGLAGAAIGGGVAGIIRTWLNRNVKFIKNWDNQIQERAAKYGNEKDLRLINNYIEGSAQDFTAEYFGVGEKRTEEDKKQQSGSVGKVAGTAISKTIGTIGGWFGFGKKAEKRELKTVTTDGEVSSEGALTLGAIIAKSLEEQPEAKAGKEYEVDGRKITLTGDSNEIYLRAVADLAVKNIDLDKEVVIKNKLLLKLFELQSVDAKALTEVGFGNKYIFPFVDKLYKTMTGRGSDNSARAYLGASVVGAGVGSAFFANNDIARGVMGGVGGASLGSKIAESGIRTQLENESRAKTLGNLDQLRLRISNYENTIDDEDKEETQKMVLDLRNLKNGTSGDLGEILALQNNPVLRATAETLLKEAETSGIISPEGKKELSLDFSDLNKVKESLFEIDSETSRREKEITKGVKRSLSGKAVIKKVGWVVAGAAVTAGAALLLGYGAKSVKHEFGTYKADQKLDNLLTGKDAGEKARILEHFSGNKDIKTVDDLPQEKLDELNNNLNSENAKAWLHNQEVEIRREDVVETENLFKSQVSDEDYKLLLKHLAGGKQINSLAELSDDKLKEVLDHKNDQAWLTQQSRSALVEAHANEITGIKLKFEDANIVKMLGGEKNISDVSNSIINNLRSQNPKLSAEQLAMLVKGKIEDLYTTAQDVSGGKKADMDEVAKMVQADLVKHNGDIDVVLRDLRATVGKGEGISHALSRQFKAELLEARAKGEDLSKLGFKGDITSERAIQAWADHQAGVLAKKSGFYGDSFDVHVKSANTTQAFLRGHGQGGHTVELKNSENNLVTVNRVVGQSKVETALPEVKPELDRNVISHLEDQEMLPYNHASGNQEYFTDADGKHWVPQGYVKDNNGDLVTVLKSGEDVLFFKGTDQFGVSKDSGLIHSANTLYNIRGERMGTINPDADDHEMSLGNKQKVVAASSPRVNVSAGGGGGEKVGTGLPKGFVLENNGSRLVLEAGNNKINVGSGVPEKDLPYLQSNFSRLTTELKSATGKVDTGIDSFKLEIAKRIIESGGTNVNERLTRLMNGGHVDVPKNFEMKPLDIHGHKITLSTKLDTAQLGLLENNLKSFDSKFGELEALKSSNPELCTKVSRIINTHFDVLKDAVERGNSKMIVNFDSGTSNLPAQALMGIHLNTLADLRPNAHGDFEIPAGSKKITI